MWPQTFFDAGRRAVSPVTRRPHIERLLRDPTMITADTVTHVVRSVNVIVESRCNLGCSFCHYRHTQDEGFLGHDFPLDRVLPLLDEVPHAGVAITGGEPLLSPARMVAVAKVLLQKNRRVTLVTNGLLLAEPGAARDALGGALTSAERRRLLVRCSFDAMHQQGSGLPVEDYARRGQAAIRCLIAAGFRVITRSVVTTARDYAFFRAHVVPLFTRGETVAATLQPNIYRLREFLAAFEGGELGGIADWLEPGYIASLRREHRPSSDARRGASPLRTAPWVLVEINARGVKGPSPFLPAVRHHESVFEMLRSYDWLRIADAITPQLTITRNAFPYRIDRRDRTVGVDPAYLLRRLLRRG